MSRILRVQSPILSLTLPKIQMDNDPVFIHRTEHLRYMRNVKPKLEKVAANSLYYSHRSSQEYGPNNITYKVNILLQDFYVIAKDRGIPLIDAIEYSLMDGDAHVSCTCPSFLYWGFRYKATKLKYLYGLPKENRFPVERNPELIGTTCKHIQATLNALLDDIDTIVSLFEKYYKRLPEAKGLFVVDAETEEAEEVEEESPDGAKDVDLQPELDFGDPEEEEEEKKEEEKAEPPRARGELFPAEEMGELALESWRRFMGGETWV